MRISLEEVSAAVAGQEVLADVALGLEQAAASRLLDDVGGLIDELARRLNLEAAKAVKYGGTPEIEALKFVTINPAKQLQIDRRVGSLEPGKDADLVVWNGNPLSTMARAPSTSSKPTATSGFG